MDKGGGGKGILNKVLDDKTTTKRKMQKHTNTIDTASTSYSLFLFYFSFNSVSVYVACKRARRKTLAGPAIIMTLMTRIIKGSIIRDRQ